MNNKPKVLHRAVKGYSGPVIYGDVILPTPPYSSKHLERAVWLNGEIETGNRMGSIMAADGTGMTAGDGYIAVYPKELANEDWNAKDDQGDLWALLASIQTDNARSLFTEFQVEDWSLTADGTLRWSKDSEIKVSGKKLQVTTGDPVHGAYIRNVFTPPNGKVPKSGDEWMEAKEWALAFHNVFADEKSFKAQAEYNQSHLWSRINGQRLKFSVLRRPATMAQAIYGVTSNPSLLRVGKEISEEFDLAMCIVHSFAINAPFYAYRALVGAVQTTGWQPSLFGSTSELWFARTVLDNIKVTKYGNWQKRWERTRETAMNSGLWDKDLFVRPDGIMTPR